jgi:hypothetical protein
MTMSRSEILFRGMIALAVVLGIASATKADTIVQTADFHFATHGTMIGQYQQFDPRLGTLTEVGISVTGNFASEQIAFFNTSLTETVSFNGFVDDQLSTDAGPSQAFHFSFMDQLPPGGETFQGVGGTSMHPSNTLMSDSG